MANQRLTLPIEGMSCAACAVTVQGALGAVSGVAQATVNYATGKASVDYDDTQTGIAALVHAVREAGYDAGQARVSFVVSELHYAPSVAGLERTLGAVPGVLRAVANQATETVTVTYVPGVTTTDQLETAVTQAGFQVAAPIAAEDPVERERLARDREVRQLTWKFVLAALVGLVSMVGSMATMTGPKAGALAQRLHAMAAHGILGDARTMRWLLALVTLPVVLWSGRQFYRGAWSGFRHRTADMNTLIAVGTGAALLYSLAVTVAPALFTGAGLTANVYYEVVSAVIALVLLGRLLEARARGATSAAIRRLAALTPAVAHVVQGAATEDVAVAALVEQQLVLVRPGERVPADGVITEGSSDIDESM